MIVHIPDVKSKLVLPSQRIPATDLSPAGHAWLDLMSARLLGRIQRQILHKQRPGTDQAHLAFQHIP